MKLLALTLIGSLALAPAALAADNTSRSGTENSTGPQDAGSGSTPGAQGKGPTTGDKSRSGTENSTGARDAGSGEATGAKGQASPAR